MSNKTCVLNVQVDIVTMNEAVAKVAGFIAEKHPRLVVTTNAEMVMLAQTDKELFDIINDADLVVPDGAGVVWAARHQGCHIPERVAGCDLVQNLLRHMASKSMKVYLFGGAPGIVETVQAKIQENYQGVQVVGIRNGFFSKEEEADIIADIKQKAPDMLLAALGVPKQEKWLKQHLQEMRVPVSMGVGGTFDVMAGAVKRAPLWMQRANLEWLFRLSLQPQRIGRMLALPRFVVKVLAHSQ